MAEDLVLVGIIIVSIHFGHPVCPQLEKCVGGVQLEYFLLKFGKQNREQYKGVRFV